MNNETSCSPAVAQTDTGPGEEKRNRSEDALDPRTDDNIEELREANEDLRRQIAEQQREIETLQKMLQVSSDVIQAVPAGLFLFQYQPPGELFFLNGNPEAIRLTGQGQEDCRGMELDEIWPNARGQGLTQAFLDVARTGEPFQAGKALYRNSKTERVFRVKALAMPGQRLGVVFLDLTDQTRAEEAIRRAQDELTQRVEDKTSELASRNKRMESENSQLRLAQETALESCRLAAQEEVAGNAARLMADPMESLQEAVQRALARLDSGYMSLVRPSLDQIQQSANQLSSLVKHLRQFARMAPRTGLSECRPVDLSGLVGESVETIRKSGGGNAGADPTFAFEEISLGPDCLVKGEPPEILDVVNILLKHVLNAPFPREKVMVETFSEAERVVLEIGVNCEGIPMDELSRAFETFGPASSSHTGLELAAVAGVIRRYGGDLTFGTSTDSRVTITVRLPRVSKP
jgi:signal transduction histidine kinase